MSTSIRHNDETIDLQISASIFSGGEVRLLVPQKWEYAELIIEDKIVDRIDFIMDKKILKTLDNDIVPAESINGLKQSRERTSIWINEIILEPK